MKYFYTHFLSLFFFISFISAKNYEIIEDKSNLKIKTFSLKDQKRIKLKLKNGLLAYIISDPNTKESAAAISVKTGYWNNPKKIPGLAHLIEHILFLSKKESFFNFISQSKGNINAYTSFDRTIFLFSLPNSHFQNGLLKFSTFFTSSKFDPKTKEANSIIQRINKEKEAIEHEYKLKFENDDRKISYVLKECGNQNHPNYKFSCGNKDTLSNVSLKDIQDWYNKYYIANNMYLTIYTNLPIEKMIAFVEKNFQNIPNKKTLSQNSENTPFLFSKNQKASLIKIINPTKNIKTLSLYWEIDPSIINNINTKSSLDLLSYTINYSQNYLFQKLRKKDLIKKIQAQKICFGKKNGIFEIQAGLTEKGSKEYLKVIKACFKTINFLKTKKDLYKIFEQMKTIKRLKYEYQDKAGVFEEIYYIANTIIDEDFQTFPQNTYIPVFDEKNIKEILKNLTPFTCSFVLTKKEESNNKNFKTEKWYKTNYQIQKLDEKILFSLDKKAKNINFCENNYIPKEIQLLNTKNCVSKIIDNQHAKIYYIQKDYLKSPKTSLFFKIYTPFSENIKNILLKKLFINLLKEKMRFLLKQANYAKTNANIYLQDNAIIFHIYGYKSQSLLKNILENSLSLSCSKKTFQKLKNNLLIQLQNKNLEIPAIQSLTSFYSHINKTIFPIQIQIENLKKIIFDDFKNFLKDNFSKTYIEAIFTGNISLTNCKTFYNDLQKNIFKNSFPYKKEDNIIPITKPFQAIKNTKMEGSGILIAINKDFSFQNLAAQKILSSFIKKPFFSKIRSTQNIAYFVHTADYEINKNLFQIFLVQSSSFSINTVLQKIEDFISTFSINLEKKIDQKAFQSMKKNIIYNLKKPCKNLLELTYKKNDLLFQYQDPFFIKKLIDALENLTYKQFVELSKQFLSSKKKVAFLTKGPILKKENFIQNK